MKYYFSMILGVLVIIAGVALVIGAEAILAIEVETIYETPIRLIGVGLVIQGYVFAFDQKKST